MDYQVKNHNDFHLIGLRLDVTVDQAFHKVPTFWKDFNQKMNDDPSFKAFVLENKIGTYGVTINDEKDMNLIHYYIAGIKGDHLYEGVEDLHLEDSLWAHFTTKGSYPISLQTLNYKIYSEWFPAHPEYDFHYDASIEYLPYGDRQSDDYACELWIPIIKKD